MKREVQRELMRYLSENYNKYEDIKELCNKLIKTIQTKTKKEFPVYLTINKAQGTLYVKAKTFFLVDINKVKPIHIHVGKLSKFPNGIKDKEVEIIARQKLMKKMDEIINKFGL